MVECCVRETETIYNHVHTIKVLRAQSYSNMERYLCNLKNHGPFCASYKLYFIPSYFYVFFSTHKHRQHKYIYSTTTINHYLLLIIIVLRWSIRCNIKIMAIIDYYIIILIANNKTIILHIYNY